MIEVLPACSALVNMRTTGFFEYAGLERAVKTASISGALTRWLMRKDLAPA